MTDAGDALWIGGLQLGEHWARWRGQAGDGAMHRHFAAQAILSDRMVRVAGPDGKVHEATAMLIDPLTAHRIEPSSEVDLIYVEPVRHRDAEVERLLGRVRSQTAATVLSSPAALPFWTNWLNGAGGSEADNDPRIEAALARIEEAIPLGAVPLERVASSASLSPERFRHLFAEQLGVPFRRYVLWRRLRLAAAGLVAGQDVTTSAHEAGFADAAHFARTLKSTFGITASESGLLRRNGGMMRTAGSRLPG